MSVTATAKQVQVSARKAGLVASLVRGRTVSDALVILEHTPKKSAKLISKVINSAKANATHNHGFKEDTLVISELTIGSGPALKRFRAGAFGRGHPYKHHTSHIHVVLDGQKIEDKAPKKAATKKTEKEKK